MADYQLEKEIAERRSNDFAIQALILNRWSPRSFLEKSVPEEEILAVLDSARWAPSCFNEQPWRFIVTREEEALHKMQSCLAEQNQQWANRAPVLIAVISKPEFSHNGKKNRWNHFDTGAAWACLALEAKVRGLITHAMGGFFEDKVRVQFKIPADWGIHAIVALGYQGPSNQLSREIQEREIPSTRKPLHELWREGHFDF